MRARYPDSGAVRSVGRGTGTKVGMRIEYRCPTHGKVEPENEGAAVPTCPMTIRRTVNGELVPETCGQPLTAYMG
jgi:hypothetical protein